MVSDEARRVLVVTGFWPTTTNSITGIFVVQQVAAFARKNCRVTVMVCRTVGRRSGRTLNGAELGLPSDLVSVVRVGIPRIPDKLSGLSGAVWINSVMAGILISRTIRRHALHLGAFDLGVAHGVRYAGLSTPWWSRYVSGGVVIVLHGVDPFIRRSPDSVVLRRIFKSTGHNALKVVLVGSPLCSYAELLGVPNSRMVVIPNGTDLPKIEAVAESQNEVGAIRRVASVSNLVEIKGIDLNLRALAEVSRRRPDISWRYRVIGEGPEVGRLRSLCRDLGIARYVSFVGRLPYSDTMEEIARCDVFSLPSWGEAFGIVYLEAMARMRPVIGCKENGAADIITSGSDGLLVPPKDVDALAAALELLLDSPSVCRSMGLRARSTAERFSWDTNAQSMLSLFQEEACTRV